MRNYKGKGGYSAVGLEQRVIYVFKLCSVKKIVKTKFIHMTHSFLMQI